MSVKDLTTVVKELVDKEIEIVMNKIKDDIKDIIGIVDKKIEELRQYLKS
jgi:hypothetical protein